MKQLTFTKTSKQKDIFGGSLTKSHPKTARPLDSKLPIHLVLRANESRLRKPQVFGKVERTISETCKKHGVKLYRHANVGNHLHLLIKISRRPRWAAFIRELTGRVAQVAQKLGPNEKAKQHFWKVRPFTRIVRGWGKAFRTMKSYVELNRLEAEGFINRKEIKNLRELKELLSG